MKLTGCMMFPPASWHPIQARPNNAAPLCISVVCASDTAPQKKTREIR